MLRNTIENIIKKTKYPVFILVGTPLRISHIYSELYKFNKNNNKQKTLKNSNVILTLEVLEISTTLLCSNRIYFVFLLQFITENSRNAWN